MFLPNLNFTINAPARLCGPKTDNIYFILP